MKTSIVLLAVPFLLEGAFWLLYILGYNMSVAAWVGLIALAGLDAETGVVMFLYLDHPWEKFRAAGRVNSMNDLQAAVIEGAVQRIRPKIMIICAILFGLLPIMWSRTTHHHRNPKSGPVYALTTLALSRAGRGHRPNTDSRRQSERNMLFSTPELCPPQPGVAASFHPVATSCGPISASLPAPPTNEFGAIRSYSPRHEVATSTA